MATITKLKAVARLTSAVRVAHADDLVEIYNELFPEQPTTEEEAERDSPGMMHKILMHIDRGLEVQEILDLWNVVFPLHRGVCYDDDDGLIHYDEETEPVSNLD